MSVSMNVLSSDDVNQSDYIDFLKKIGAELEDQLGLKSILYSGNAQLWICREDQLLDEYEEKDMALVKEKLKASPRCLFVLELSGDVGSSELALQFAYKLGQNWNLIVDDLYENVYSFSEIEKLYEKGGGFE